MPLNFADLIDHVEAPAGTTVDPRLRPESIVNRAGRHLCRMHQWAWLERPTYLLDFVASQDFVTFPVDFSEMVGIVGTSATKNDVILSDLSYIRYLQSSTFSETTGRYWVALEYPTQTATTLRPPPARLAIYPTPSTASTGALELQYRAGWLELSDPGSQPNVPEDFDVLLIELIRAFTLGYVMQEQGSLTRRLQEIGRSDFFMQLKSADGAAQPISGQSRGGIVSLYPRDRPTIAINTVTRS